MTSRRGRGHHTLAQANSTTDKLKSQSALRTFLECMKGMCRLAARHPPTSYHIAQPAPALHSDSASYEYCLR
jgi:predicted PhzF superfamily epimerase YddE/YHI9